MKNAEPSIRLNVDCTNPGQFFACCGVLELADRLWPGAEGWFEDHQFRVACGGSLNELLRAASTVEIEPLNPEDRKTTPLRISAPFDPPLRLDWWNDRHSGGRELKVWAGSMEGVRISLAMQNALRQEECWTPNLFDYGVIVYLPDDPRKKVEPFYFDARRAPNSHSRDIGFSPNSLSLTTTAFPAVEFLCLVGLQRVRPLPTERVRVFDYFTWSSAARPLLLPLVATGQLPGFALHGYRFENWFRTGQKKHKAFRPAVPIDIV